MAEFSRQILQHHRPIWFQICVGESVAPESPTYFTVLKDMWMKFIDMICIWYAWYTHASCMHVYIYIHTHIVYILWYIMIRKYRCVCFKVYVACLFFPSCFHIKPPSRFLLYHQGLPEAAEAGKQGWSGGWEDKNRTGDQGSAFLHSSYTFPSLSTYTFSSLSKPFACFKSKKLTSWELCTAKPKKTRLMKVTKIGSLGLEFLVIFIYLILFFVCVSCWCWQKNRVLKSAGSVFN